MKGTEKNQMQEVEELCSLLTPIQKKDKKYGDRSNKIMLIRSSNAKA
jgi:hypothetical protein